MVLCHRALVVHLLHPVGALPGTIRDGAVEIGRQHGGEIHLGNAGILAGEVVELHVLFGVDHVGHLGDVLAAIETVIGDDHASFLALFRGHEHDTVGGTCTVDGGGSSILENVDGLDVVGVENVDVTTGHTVDDIQRFGVTDRTDTADVDLVAAARLAGVLGDGNARALALQGAEGGRRVEPGQLIALHLHRRTGDEFFLLYTVTDDDGFAEHVEIRIQHDVQGAAVVDCDLSLLVAEAGHGEDGVGRCLDGIAAFRVGSSPDRHPFDDDRCKRNRVSIAPVRNRSFHGHVLCIDVQCEENRQ